MIYLYWFFGLIGAIGFTCAVTYYVELCERFKTR